MALSFWDPDFDTTLSDRWGDRSFDRWFNDPGDWRVTSRPLLDWDRPLASARRRGTEFGTSGTLRPRMDLHENPEDNTMTALFEVPGLSKENVNITVQNNRLEVSGESKLAQQYEEGGWAMRERQSGRFFRSITLPAGVTEADIKANLEHGVLTITFPKTTAEMAPKRISIH